MREIEEFVDERQKTWCIHCSQQLADVETNLDHVPSKCLLKKPRPDNLPKVWVCKDCNLSFSRDEEYVAALLSSVISGSTSPEQQVHEVAQKILMRSKKLRSRIEAGKTEQLSLIGESELLWEPEFERLKRVVVKNSRGHAFFEWGEPMLEEPSSVWIAPLEALSEEQRNTFDGIVPSPVVPEGGRQMKTFLYSGLNMTGNWVNVQDEIYRYAVFQANGLVVRTVIWEYLAAEVCWSIKCPMPL